MVTRVRKLDTTTHEYLHRSIFNTISSDWNRSMCAETAVASGFCMSRLTCWAFGRTISLDAGISLNGLGSSELNFLQITKLLVEENLDAKPNGKLTDHKTFPHPLCF